MARVRYINVEKLNTEDHDFQALNTIVLQNQVIGVRCTQIKL